MKHTAEILKREANGSANAALKVTDAERLKTAAHLGVQMICADFRPSTRGWSQFAGDAHFQFSIGYGKHKNLDLLMAEVDDAMACGAQSVYCVSHPDVIEKLAARDIPVFAHTGLVPQICTGAGGLQAVGKKLIEAERIRNTVRRFEEAGAQGIYLQLIPALLGEDITGSTELVTVSVGSGGRCDIVWAHSEDVLGENNAYVPRHAKVYANPNRQDENACFGQFLKDVRTAQYPGPEHTV